MVEARSDIRGLTASQNQAIATVASQEASGDFSRIPGSGRHLSPTPAGGGVEIKMIAGLDAVLNTTRGAIQEVVNVAHEMRILNERTLSMGQGRGTLAGTLDPHQQALISAYKDVISEQTQGIKDAVTGSGAKTPGAPSNPSPSRRGPRDTSAASKTSQTTPDQADSTYADAPLLSPEESGVKAPTKPPTNQELYDRRKNYFKNPAGGSGFSVANLRQDLGTRVSGKMENWNYGKQLTQENGVWTDPLHPHAAVSEHEVAAFQRREKLVGSVRTAANAVSQGATLRQAGMGMLPAVAAKTLGVAGAAFTVGQQIGQQITSQRSKNNAWISQMGGGQSEAFTERLGGQMFKLSQFGTLDGGDADKLYRGVAETGMNKDYRNQAQDFAIDAYKNLGMSIDQSVEIIQFAATHGQESLDGLAESLTNVSSAASAAGVNTEVARTAFTENWKAITETLGAKAAVPLAQAQTISNTIQGPEMAGLSSAAQNEPDFLRYAAATVGKGEDYNTFISQSPQKLLTAQEAATKNFIHDNFLTKSATAYIDKSWANRQAVKDDPNSQAGYTEVEHDKVAKFLQQGNNMIPLDIMKGMLSRAGLDPNMGVDQIINSVMNAQTGFGSQSGVAAALAKKAGLIGKTKMIDTSGVNRGSLDLTQTANGGIAAMFAPNSPAFQQQIDEASVSGEAGNAYIHDVMATGRSGGTSEAIIKNKDNFHLTEVEVNTADGPRAVSLTEALTYFRDQIDSGKAKVLNGAKRGTPVSEAIGAKADKSVKVISDKDGYTGSTPGDIGSTDPTKVGKSLDDYNKDHPVEGQGSTGNLVVSPTPLLLQLLHWDPSMAQGVSVPGQQSGDPQDYYSPPNPYPTPNSRPSGRAPR